MRLENFLDKRPKNIGESGKCVVQIFSMIAAQTLYPEKSSMRNHSLINFSNGCSHQELWGHFTQELWCFLSPNQNVAIDENVFDTCVFFA